MRPGPLAASILACALLGAALAAAVARAPGEPARPVVFWMRDDDDSRAWDAPGGRVLLRVHFTPHRFDDESPAATLVERADWTDRLLGRVGLAPRPPSPWTAQFLESRTAVGARWHRFVRTSDFGAELAPDPALAGEWIFEGPAAAGGDGWNADAPSAGIVLAADGGATGLEFLHGAHEVRRRRGRWGARDGLVRIVWETGPEDAPAVPRLGLVSEDGTSIRGIAGTPWRARRPADGTGAPR